MITTTVWRLVVIGTAAFLAGCVDPGELSNSFLSRYQAAMARAERNPQARRADGLSLLQPAPGLAVPKLVTYPGSDGGTSVRLTLDEAIRRALANNLDIAVASYNPAIARQDVIAAAAAFDYVLFGGASMYRNMIPSNVPNYLEQTKYQQYQAGLKNHSITGADWEVGWTLTRTWTDTELASAHTRYSPSLMLQVTQPLLKNGWPEYNLSVFRLARISKDVSDSQFRQRVEQSVFDTIQGYWNLAQARESYQIERDLLTATEETLRKVKLRQELDATDVQVEQAKAAVATRKAALIRAAKVVKDTQEALARLLADPQMNMLSKYEIITVSQLNTAPVTVNNEDQLMTAMANSPLLEQARLAITSADINVKVAENQRLPQLDLTAQAGSQSLGTGSFHASNSYFWEFDMTASVGVLLTQPIGNRAAEADYAKARMQRLQSITAMQNTADQVAQLVNERVRQISTSYEEIQAQTAAVNAASVQLKALEAIEDIRGRLTPEFLNLKLSAQETLANARLGELGAKISYNVAFMQLAQATGTLLEVSQIKLAIPSAIGNVAWPRTDLDPQSAPAPTRPAGTRPE
ncbi:MAG: TolC family protein [Planctomycetes bacterium]|nr:TolC family protein [Planctomycetota bacterium]